MKSTKYVKAFKKLLNSNVMPGKTISACVEFDYDILEEIWGGGL